MRLYIGDTLLDTAHVHRIASTYPYHADPHPHRNRSRRGACGARHGRSAFRRAIGRQPDGRRCGGGPTASPGSPRRSCRSSSRPRAPARSGAGSPRPSIRSSRRRSCGRARRGWRGLACRRRKSARSRKSPAPSRAASSRSLRLRDLPADDAHAALTAVHGIGPWTADIYLLSCLGHADAWPAGDLALQEAARLAFGLRARPTAKEMVRSPSRGGRCAPWRRACCGPIIAPSKDVTARRSCRKSAEKTPPKKEVAMAAELDGPN